jgi:hypothetical protein
MYISMLNSAVVNLAVVQNAADRPNVVESQRIERCASTNGERSGGYRNSRMIFRARQDVVTFRCARRFSYASICPSEAEI